MASRGSGVGAGESRTVIVVSGALVVRRGAGCVQGGAATQIQRGSQEERHRSDARTLPMVFPLILPALLGDRYRSERLNAQPEVT